MATTYQEPKIRIRETFEAPVTSTSPVLTPTIVGPQYDLYLVDENDPDQTLKLGSYDPTTNATYPWPVSSGDQIDVSYATLKAVNALIKYFEDAKGSGDTINVSGNSIIATNLIFVNQSAYPRSSSIPKDVSVGDMVDVTDGTSTIRTKIIGWDYETLPPTIDNAQAGTGNTPTQAFADSISYTGSPSAGDITATVDGSGYDGRLDGVMSETYVITVTATDGTPAGTTLSVVSASGTDDQSSVTPAAWGSPTSIGTRGLTVTFNHTSDPFVVDQQWTASVTQAYTEPTPTSQGSFTGTFETTYIVSIVNDGGTQKYIVTTTNGVDNQDLTALPGGDPITLTVGNYGVQLQLSQPDGVVTGDYWTIDVHPERNGGIKILKTEDDLSTLTGDVGITLMEVDNIDIPKYNLSQHWSATSTEISVYAGIKINMTIGTQTSDFELLGGDLYIQFRVLSLQNVSAFVEIDSTDAVSDILGQIHPDNPAAFAAYMAKSNTSQPIYVQTVATDDAAGYSDAFEKLTTTLDLMSIVPLTQDQSILNSAKGFILDELENNHFMLGWFVSKLSEEIVAQVDDGNGNDLLATITSNGDGTSTLVTTASINFVDTVKINDVVRYNYRTERGEIVYDTTKVTAVVSATSLKVEGSITQSPAAKVEVWHPVTKQEAAEQIAGQSQSYNHFTIRNIWPDKARFVGYEDYGELPGYYIAAVLAALRSSVYPHQGLTSYPVPSIDPTTPRLLYFDTRTLLNTVAAGGTWILVNKQGTLITRHQLTTDMTSANTREDSIIANMHIIAKQIYDVLTLGTANVTDRYISQLRHNIGDIIRAGQGNIPSELLGPQIIDGTVEEIKESDINQNAIEATVSLNLPDAVNEITITLRGS